MDKDERCEIGAVVKLNSDNTNMTVFWVRDLDKSSVLSVIYLDNNCQAKTLELRKECVTLVKPTKK